MGQLIFGRYMVLPIKHTIGWKLTHQKKQTQINKGIMHKNRNQSDHDYKLRDKSMLANHTA